MVQHQHDHYIITIIKSYEKKLKVHVVLKK